jgi:hypothetical protein
MVMNSDFLTENKKCIMKRIKLIICFYAMAVLLPAAVFSCTEKEMEPVSASKGKPDRVTVTGEPERIPGGAIISFQAPANPDILGVKAVYEVNGKEFTSTVSYYENRLRIEGYIDTAEHVAKLYTVNRAQELSDEVAVPFRPQESSLVKVIPTVRIEAYFRGARFMWKNEDRASLIFSMLASDDNGNLRTVQMKTSGAGSDYAVLRGFDSRPRQFALVISDKWGNVSETIYPDEGLLTPVDEQQLNKNIMSFLSLENDTYWTAFGQGANLYKLLDGISLLNDNLAHSDYHTVPGASFTVDVGSPAKISRMIVYQRQMYDRYFNAGNVQLFEVYGRKDPPSQNGDWAEWTKIMECEVVKPSPGTGYSEDDLAAAEAGAEFLFPVLPEDYQYLRIKIIKSFEGDWAYFTEMTLFGMLNE